MINVEKMKGDIFKPEVIIYTSLYYTEKSHSVQ